MCPTKDRTGTFTQQSVKIQSWRVSGSLSWVGMSWKTDNVISHPCEVKLSVAGPEEPVRQTTTVRVPGILFVSL